MSNERTCQKGESAHAAGRPNVYPHDGQRSVRPAASFFPPDFSGFGIDLEALALAALPRLDDVLRAADQLLRSGAFGLVVLDLERAGSEEELSRGARRFAGGRGVAPGEFMAPLAVQVRLANLCQRHDATLLCLTERKGFVLSGIRGETRREREREGFRCSVDVVKDKKSGGAWEWGGGFRGPVGLR